MNFHSLIFISFHIFLSHFILNFHAKVRPSSTKRLPKPSTDTNSQQTDQIVMKIDSFNADFHLCAGWHGKKSFFLFVKVQTLNKYDDIGHTLQSYVPATSTPEIRLPPQISWLGSTIYTVVMYPFQNKLTLFPLDLINDSIISL